MCGAIIWGLGWGVPLCLSLFGEIQEGGGEHRAGLPRGTDVIAPDTPVLNLEPGQWPPHPEPP